MKHNISKDEFFDVRNGFKVLEDQGIIPENYMPLFNDFRVLRDELSHAIEENITADAAHIYAKKALAPANYIKKS